MLNGIVSGRPMFANVDIDLLGGQKIVADGKTLLWMDGEMKMDTNCHGGMCDAIWRKCAGESCCMNHYDSGSKIGLGFTMPGDMMSFGVTPGNGWILSHGAFVAGSSHLKVSGKCAGICGVAAGQGAVLVHVHCDDSKRNGMFFAGGFGSIVRHEIGRGQCLMVEHGMFFAAHELTQLRVGLISGTCCAKCCSGEGFVMKFWGPAVVFTQSRNPSIFHPPKRHQADPASGMAGV